MSEGKRFLDTSLDQGSAVRDRIRDDFIGVQSIDTGVGERQVPGQDEFRLADAPQAWIFIQKKEWLDDSWTYVVSDPVVKVGGEQVDLNELADEIEVKRAELSRKRTIGSKDPSREKDIARLQKEIETLQEKQVKARQELSKRAGQLQVDGKLTQINIRTALGNVITRKLDWMHDHEKFAKLTTLSQQQFEGIQLGKERQRLVDTLLSVDEEKAKIDGLISLLEEQNISLIDTIIDLDNLIAQAEDQLNQAATDEEEQEIQNAINVLERRRTIAINRERRNSTHINRLRARQSAIGRAALAVDDQDPVLEKETSLIYAPVTLSGNAFTRYYKSPVFKNVKIGEARQVQADLEESAEALRSEIKSLVGQTRTAREREELFQKQTEYIEVKRGLDTLRTRLELQSQTGTIKLETGNSIFNGVIELANVPSVQTTVSLEGEGSASFTIENPQNIFFISREDVDLALTEDPFLDSARAGIDGLVYYRGRFYPEHIVRMFLSRKGSAIDVRTEVLTARVEVLRNQLIPALTEEIATKQQEAVLQHNLGSEGEAQRLLQEVASALQDLEELRRELQSLTTRNIQQVINEQTEKDRERQTSEQQAKEREMQLVSQTLLKYYVGKTIFQVLDRVYIWMTSPTRTLYRLNRTGTDRFAIEDPSVIAISQQLVAAEGEVAAVRQELTRAEDFIEDHISADGQPLGDDPNTLFQVAEEFQGFSDNGTQLLASQVEVYADKLSAELVHKRSVLDFLREQIKSTDHVTGANTFSKIPTSPELGLITKEQQQAIGEYDTRFLGIEEDRLQVFQGVISTVKQTYSNGKYQIQVSCKDNMVFLNMSRIMVKPALRNSGQSPQGILQDPIWRNNGLAGNWKNGILVLDFAFVNDEVGAKLDKRIAIDADEQANFKNRNVAGESEMRRKVSPFVTSLPFARIDAANLVSFIITGVPYNFEQFIKNASFGGRLLLDRKSGTTDQRSEDPSFFAFLKRQIGELNDRLGDFEPFIDLEHLLGTARELEKKREELTEARVTTTEKLADIYQNYILNRVTRYLQRLGTTAGTSILNTVKINTVEVALQPTNNDFTVFRARAQRALDNIKKARLNEPDSVLNQLTTAVVNAASRNIINDEAAGRTATTGQVVGTETEIQDIVKRLLGTDSNSGEVGPFVLIGTIVRDVAKETFKNIETDGIKRGPPIEGGQQLDLKSRAVQNAVEAFVRELLIVQPEFAEEYLAASITSTELASFDKIKPRLEEFLKDLETNDARAVSKAFKEGPQSTLEKIIRQEKKNFLIISDRYSLDNNLQAYHTVLGRDFALWQSEFETPVSVCRRAADQVDFEFYADENGNLQFKPPTYNRILKEHFPLISETDVTVRDSILVRYGNNSGEVLRTVLRSFVVLNEVKNEFSTKRLKIRQDLNTAEAEIEKLTPVTEKQKEFINPGFFGKLAISSSISDAIVAQKKNEDLRKGLKEELEAQDQLQLLLNGTGNSELGTVTSISLGLNAENQALETARKLRLIESKSLVQIELASQLRSQELQAAREELNENKKNLATAKEANDIANANLLSKIVTAQQSQVNLKEVQIKFDKLKNQAVLYTRLVDRINTLIKEAETVRERARKKAEGFVTALPTFTDEHRIHRIQDHDLISYDFTEAPPRYTHLEITGSPELVQVTPAEYYWAGGVDYDNWRHYGFLSESIQRAYFHSGAVAKTYLRALLGRERGRIFSASVQVRGDAKYHVGDCVFIESLGMYFYITQVSHSLSYGQSYTTSITLQYGRRIGELIPHPFDALGKIMIDTYQNDLEILLAREQFLELEKEKQLRS